MQPTNKTVEEVLSAAAVARLLGYASGENVKNWGIPYRTVPTRGGGVRYRFRRSDVNAFIERHSHTQTGVQQHASC